MKYEWRKKEKELYLPKEEPMLIEVPEHKFFMLRGMGNPNHQEFSEAVGVLYSLAYGVKMLPKKGITPEGYFDYTVFPLEAIWDLTEKGRQSEELIKEELIYNAMIRQPGFVTESLAQEVIEEVKRKNPHPLLQKVTFGSICDGLSVQMLHIGPYNNEPESFRRMEDFCTQKGLKRTSKVHREIYISDARKVTPEALKTVLRFGVVE